MTYLIDEIAENQDFVYQRVISQSGKEVHGFPPFCPQTELTQSVFLVFEWEIDLFSPLWSPSFFHFHWIGMIKSVKNSESEFLLLFRGYCLRQS